MGNVESGMPLAEDGEGKPVLDENGEERRGVEAGRVKTCVEKGSELQMYGLLFSQIGLKKKTGSIYPEILVFALGKTRAECHPS